MRLDEVLDAKCWHRERSDLPGKVAASNQENGIFGARLQGCSTAAILQAAKQTRKQREMSCKRPWWNQKSKEALKCKTTWLEGATSKSTLSGPTSPVEGAPEKSAL